MEIGREIRPETAGAGTVNLVTKGVNGMTIINCNIHNRQDEDSCALCDEENPIWERTLSIYVDVEDKWLDPDGEEQHDEGWAELRQRVQGAIEREFQKHTARPHFNTDWEDIPERKS